MYLMRNHDIWIYVRCANSDPRIAFDRLYDLIDEAAPICPHLPMSRTSRV